MKKYFLTLCLCLGACSNLPLAIKNPPSFDISYAQAIQNIAGYRNAPVRWGGIIVDVENEQNFSLVQVLYYPLSSDGRPQTNKQNEGRFVIKTPEFLDPAVYARNTEITVAGILAGDLERAIGKKVMRLPLISPTTLHLWPVYLYDNYYDGYGLGYGPYYGVYPYYWGYYWPSSPRLMRSPYRYR